MQDFGLTKLSEAILNQLLAVQMYVKGLAGEEKSKAFETYILCLSPFANYWSDYLEYVGYTNIDHFLIHLVENIQIESIIVDSDQQGEFLKVSLGGKFGTKIYR